MTEDDSVETDFGIVRVGEPALRKRAVQVAREQFGSSSLGAVIQRMWEAVCGAEGVGLAAPQIDESVRMVVVQDLPKFVSRLSTTQQAERERQVIEPYVLINPELRPVGEQTRTFFEGCLSIPGYTAAVERFYEVAVTYNDQDGQRCAKRVSGWHARILQHEVDHLDGVLYVDRMLTRTLCASSLFAYYKDLSAELAVRSLSAGESG